MKKVILFFAIILAAAVWLTGCGEEEPEATTNTPAADTPTAAISATPVIREANVDSIEVVILESFPVQVNVRARGEFPDGCTRIDDISTTRDGTAFMVTITTIRQDDTCTEALVPFEETIPLDVLDLPAGNYTVSVNGINGSFTLAADNSADAAPQPTETPTAEPEDANNAIINGRVWHDLCAVAGGEGDEPAIPSEGCIAAADGETFQANGLLDEGEPGLEGVQVSLGEGECPASGLTAVITDEDGDYVFTDLSAGTYCVSVDPTAAENELLLPGQFTFPGLDEGSLTVTLAEGEVLTEVNFGWDYEFLPVPEVDLANCTNSIEFVQDLSIPDDTVFTAGTEFEKTWQLRNNGTCPWTTEYSLVFVGGDEIPGPTEVPLEAPVVPGQTVELSVALTAPEDLGTYRSNWQIADAAGNPFGVGGLIDEAFWVQIVVGEAEATPEPNSAAIGGVVWEDFCTVDADGDPTAGCVEIEDSGFYRADGSLNFNESRLPGITVKLAAGACPADAIVTADTVLQTTVTDEDGLYRFTNLEDGTYCVAIDAFSEDNVNLLIPGDWTWPAPGVGLQGVVLSSGQEELEIDFGWDYQD